MTKRYRVTTSFGRYDENHEFVYDTTEAIMTNHQLDEMIMEFENYYGELDQEVTLEGYEYFKANPEPAYSELIIEAEKI
jgi:hypothetical protein